MNTNMTRRSVALAGPTALALKTLGPVATLATLGGISTQANALTYDGGLYWLNGFFDFYEDKFKAFAAKLTRRAIAYQYTLAYLAGNASVVPGSTQWFSVYESFATKALDASVAHSYYNSLSAAAQEQTHDRSRTWFIDSTTDSRLNLPAKPYAPIDMSNWNALAKSLTKDHVGQIKWQDMRNWHKLVYFVKAIATDADFATLAQKSTAVETDENARFLRGTVADSLKEVKPYLYGNSWWVMNWGNARKPVERAELVNTRSWFETLFRLAPIYDETSVIQHGVNTTAIVPETSTVISEDYVLTEIQQKGIDYYVNKDIADNGPYPNTTVAESRRMLRSATEFVAKDTGLVHPSYLYAQDVVRATQQYTVAVTRHFLFKDRYLDLQKMQAGIITHIEGNWFYRWTHVSPRAALSAALLVLTASMIATLVLQSLALHDTNDAVDENSGKNTTLSMDVALAQQKLLARSTPTSTVASLLAIGFLATAGFVSSTGASIIAKVAIAGCAPMFALTDLTSSTTLIAEVIRNRTQNTTEGRIKLAQAGARLTGAGFSIFDLVLKIYNKTFKSSFGTWYYVHPLTYNTLTAATAASLSVILAVLAKP